MVEFRGAAAVAAAAVLGIFALGFAVLTFWWLSRNPKVGPRVLELRPRFRTSVALGLLALLGLLVYAVILAFDLSN